MALNSPGGMNFLQLARAAVEVSRAPLRRNSNGIVFFPDDAASPPALVPRLPKQAGQARRGKRGSELDGLKQALQDMKKEGNLGEKPVLGANFHETMLPRRASLDVIDDYFIPEKPRGAEMVLDKVEVSDIGGLLGHCQRSPVTGLIYLQEVEKCRDFTMVDLWTRDQIVGLPEELAKDRHLFWAVPLKRRTWIYHEIYRHSERRWSLGKKVDAVKRALSEKCLDANMNNGDRSPVMWFAPTLPLMLLASDTLAFVLGFILLFLCHLISIVTNNHWTYWLTRTLSLPFRIGFVAVLFIRLNAAVSVDFLVICGFLAPILIFAGDIVMGDLQSLLCLKLTCSYKILRELPNQVFVCQRIGDNERAHGRVGDDVITRGNRHGLCEEITGVAYDTEGASKVKVTLIANVQGVLVELLPVDPALDAQELRDELRRGVCQALGSTEMALLDALDDGEEDDIEGRLQQSRMRYFAMDIFDLKNPDVRTLEAKEARRKQLQKLHEHLQEWATASPKDEQTQMHLFRAEPEHIHVEDVV